MGSKLCGSPGEASFEAMGGGRREIWSLSGRPGACRASIGGLGPFLRVVIADRLQREGRSRRGATTEMTLKAKPAEAGRRLNMHVCVIPSAVVAQAIAAAGADCVIINQEHGPISFETLHAMVASTQGTECAPLVRVPEIHEVRVKGALDAGAEGICFPLIRAGERHCSTRPPDPVAKPSACCSSKLQTPSRTSTRHVPCRESTA